MGVCKHIFSISTPDLPFSVSDARFFMPEKTSTDISVIIKYSINQFTYAEN